MENTNSILQTKESATHFVESCVEKAKKSQSNLTPFISKLSGMSSVCIKNLLNNLCQMPHTRYLEIGLYTGSTFVSAMFKNDDTVESSTAIDMWKFHGEKSRDIETRITFLLRTESYVTLPFTLIEKDCFDDNVIAMVPNNINIYFFDGDHGEREQRSALIKYYDKLANRFIMIVDDWGWEGPKKGTMSAIAELNITVEYQVELGLIDGRWHNGVSVLICSKNK